MWDHNLPSYNPRVWRNFHGLEDPYVIDVNDTSGSGNGALIGAPYGPIYVNDFDLSQRYFLLAWNKTWNLCNARMKIDFLDSGDNLVIGIKCERASIYTNHLYWTTNGTTYTDFGTATTYSASVGTFTFDSSNIYWTADTDNSYANFGTQYVGNWSKAISMSSVTKIKIWDCYLYSDYSGYYAIVYAKFARKNYDWLIKNLI